MRSLQQPRNGVRNGLRIAGMIEGMLDELSQRVPRFLDSAWTAHRHCVGAPLPVSVLPRLLYCW